MGGIGGICSLGRGKLGEAGLAVVGSLMAKRGHRVLPQNLRVR